MNERLRLLRDALGLTLAQFGDRIGIDGGNVSAWEMGRVKLPATRQARICEEFGVNPDWLATGEGEMFTRPVDPAVLERLDQIRRNEGTIMWRLCHLRKTLRLSTTQFAERLGLSRSVVCGYEHGRSPIPETRFRQICIVFGVNPEWFKTGVGEMFLKAPQAEDKLDAATQLALGALDSLPSDVQSVILDIARRLLKTDKRSAKRKLN